MIKRNLFLLLSLSISILLSAQPVQRCHAHEYDQELMRQHPEMRESRAEIYRVAEQYAQANASTLRVQNTVVIPVVFHIVYKNNSENISSNRLLEQIQILNEDYTKQNADRVNVPAVWSGIAANCDIQFCLAKIDPNNNWTSGIERVSTTVQSFSLSNGVKSTSTGGLNAWDASKYLNIWVCDLDDPFLGGILGYAQFPGGPASTDGVVLDYLYVGKTGASAPFNRGRTATHEVGHWLGLPHIWGDDFGACSGSDFAADTPNQANETYGSNAVGQVITDACAPNSPGIMWMNYMDYTNDASMYMFTNDQKTLMWSVLNNSRSSILTSTVCTPLSIAEYQPLNMISIYPTPADGRMTIEFGALDNTDVDIQIFNTLGQQVFVQRYALVGEARIELELSELAAGVYTLELVSGEARAVRKIVIE